MEFALLLVIGALDHAIRKGINLASFSIHFDGAITTNHKVTVRVLAKTYEHMQRAIDRAYLIERYGDVWKHARLKRDQYAETEFLAAYPREGGIILDAVRDGAGAIIERVASAIRPVFEGALKQGLSEHLTLDQQLSDRRVYVRQMGEHTQTFQALREDHPANWASAYSNRSVVKEVDQLVAQVTPRHLEGSTVSITLSGNQPHLPFEFTPEIARRFHIFASKRDLGAATIVNARIRSLDRGNDYAKPNAKIMNLATGREVILHLPGDEDVMTLHPFLAAQEVRIFACPIIEAGGFDLNGGDLMFVGIA